MGTKMAVAFPNHLQSRNRNPQPKRIQTSRLEATYRRHFLPLGHQQEVLTQFIDQANNDHPTIKFTAEISDTADTSVYKGQRFIYESVLDIRTTTSPLKNGSTLISPRITHLGPDVRKRVSANCGLNVDHGF